MSYLTVEEIRDFIMDRSSADNELLRDVAYTDEEILKAMRNAARAYNSVPPFVHSVRFNRLPGDSDLFLHATAEQLCGSMLSKLRRNDVDMQAGDVQANLTQKRISHLSKEREEHRSIWMEEAKNFKLSRNVSMCFGRVG